MQADKSEGSCCAPSTLTYVTSSLTLAQAALKAGVSLSTAKRRLPLLKLAGARKSDNGSWSIPLEALRILTSPAAQDSGSGSSGLDPAQGDLSELRAALTAAERRAAVAEALAQERAERLTVMDAQLARVLTQAQEHAARLTSLEAARQVARLQPAPLQEGPPEVRQRQRWWRGGPGRT